MDADRLMTMMYAYKMIGSNDWLMGKIKRIDQAILSETKIGTSQYMHIFLYKSMET